MTTSVRGMLRSVIRLCSQEMEGTETTAMETLAFENGRALLDLSDHLVSAVLGNDAAKWLNDLVTAKVDRMTPGRACGSFLLDPTGHIRAHFVVVRTWQSFLLIQDPAQPDPVDDLLSKYVLSSDVTITREKACIFAVPGSVAGPPVSWSAAPAAPEHGGGTYLGAPAERHDETLDSLSEGLVLVSKAAQETVRIGAGIPRYPVDLAPRSIPAEAPALAQEIVDTEKGCFLGQESVARVRNLGHPPNLIVALRTDATVSVGEPVTEGGKKVGQITSAAVDPAGTTAIARVRWFAHPSPRFQTAHGHPFTMVRGG